MTAACGRALAAALLVLGAAPAVAVAAPALRLHYPPDRLLVAGDGLVHVVADLPGVARPEMEVAVNGAPVASAARGQPGQAPVLHSEFRLAPGLATITIVFRADGAEVGRLERRVFFVSPLVPTAQPPPDFARRAFHGGAGEPRCAGCHRLTPAPEDERPASPELSTCHSCHAGLTKVTNVHGPTAQWACTRCHDARDAAARYATPEPVMPLCFGCHTEQKDRFYGERYQHGPTATGHCVICHSPHGTANPFFLKKRPWDLCTTCHAEKGSGRHVIAWGPTGQSHPTKGRPDPNRPGEELSCASCHNPHAAPAPKLWNFKATGWLDLCKNCHRNLLGN